MIDDNETVYLPPLCPWTTRMPCDPGFVDGIDIFLTDSLMICRIVFRNAFLKSAVLKTNKYCPITVLI